MFEKTTKDCVVEDERKGGENDWESKRRHRQRRREFGGKRNTKNMKETCSSR